MVHFDCSIISHGSSLSHRLSSVQTMSSAAGKRKTDDESDSVPPSLFATIPEVCWEAVSAFASPPDVYQLCLSSAHFHTEPVRSNGNAGNANGNTKKKSRSSNKPSSANVKSDAVLATRLLRSSLLSSLGRVLEKSESGITLKSALEMANLPEGSAIIAGSTMAAAVLGEVWAYRWSRADVDIFCTAKAAPQVRSVSFIIKVLCEDVVRGSLYICCFLHILTALWASFKQYISTHHSGSSRVPTPSSSALRTATSV